MARIRSIKPEFFRHEGLFDAERETGLPLRVAFAGLWTVADRDGRFEWRPRSLKLDVLPHDNVEFSRVLDALATRGFIVKYASAGTEFGYIPSWHQHQVPNNREKPSEIPEPTKDAIIPITSTREPRVNHASATPLGKDRVEREGEQEGEGEREQFRPSDGRASASNAPEANAEAAGQKTPSAGTQGHPEAKSSPGGLLLPAEGHANRDGPPDLKAQLFGPCLDWLASRTGRPANARALIGRWLKDAGSEGVLLTIFAQAQREAPIEPVAWIAAAIAARQRRSSKLATAFAGIADAVADAEGAA